ncbi:MAG TPA: hydrogenase nickel incorporation protein HypA [Deltaproteobacteria bacterium]|nr:hydrogenase nickel incorporation protein HypA [Deltaproteobacteria bacterium]
MHEAHLIQDLIHKLQAISQENGDKKIVGVQVKLGALSHMSPAHFQEHFEQASQGTCAEGARLFAEQLSDIQAPHAQEILLESVEIEE